MIKFIGNENNEKSIISNIVKGTCPNIIILAGEYGTGKTEFAKEVAKTLICTSPNMDGYCGVCKQCTENSKIVDSTLAGSITLTNMATVDHDKVTSLIHDNVSLINRTNRVFIYDEFQAVPSGLQEMWLAETSKLDKTFLILTTTQLNKVDRGIKSRAMKFSMKLIELKDIKYLLSMYDIEDVEPTLLVALYETFRGSPREIIGGAKFLMNSELTLEQQIEMIRRYKKAPIEELLEVIDSSDIYLKTLRHTIQNFNEVDLKSSASEVLWNYIAMNEEEYACTDIGKLIPKMLLTKTLILVNDSFEIAFIKLYQDMNYKSKGADSKVVNENINKKRKEKTSETPTTGSVDIW